MAALIDWALVGYSALWVFGLSLILATLSFAHYYASEAGAKFGQVLTTPPYALALNVGGVFTCAGFFGTAQMWWERAAWLALALAFGYQAWQAYAPGRRPPPSSR
jgi:hypothetical protein